MERFCNYLLVMVLCAFLAGSTWGATVGTIDPSVSAVGTFVGTAGWTWWQGEPGQAGSVQWNCNPGGSTYAMQVEALSGSGILTVPAEPTIPAVVGGPVVTPEDLPWSRKFSESPAGWALPDTNVWDTVEKWVGEYDAPWCSGYASGQAEVHETGWAMQAMMSTKAYAGVGQPLTSSYAAAYDPWTLHDFAPLSAGVEMAMATSDGDSVDGGLTLQMPISMYSVLGASGSEAGHEAMSELLIHSEIDGHLLVDIAVKVISVDGVNSILPATVSVGEGVELIFMGGVVTPEQLAGLLSSFIYDPVQGAWQMNSGIVVEYELPYDIDYYVQGGALDAKFNISCNSYAAVPEPISLVLLCGGMVMLRRARHNCSEV